MSDVSDVSDASDASDLSDASDASDLVTRIDSDASASVPSPPSAGLGMVSIGQTIDRYVVFEEIGRGGMGQVLRAYDPKLEREVALKLLLPGVLDPDAHARLVREARSMAKLSHPNVVPVYDVQEAAAGVVLVMEYVRGQTLGAWLREGERRPWPEVVARFLEAGRGLAAAHAEGLLHRDFKPSNVLIPERGPAKVTDFGLAKPASGADTVRSAPDLGSIKPAAGADTARSIAELGSVKPASGIASVLSVSSSASVLSDDTLTRHGVVLGTPRYMAPEQHCGEASSPMIDQYAFCVTLWEAVTGKAPFSGDDRTLAKHKHHGPPPWPTDVPLPRPMVEALRRGLAVEPMERWPSMDALLEALTHDPSQGRRRWLVVGAIGVLGLGSVTFGWWAQGRAQRCTGAAAQLEGIWDDARRAEVEAAVLGTQAAYAPDAWSRLQPRLDEHARAWTAMHTETCEATTIRGEQSTQVMDLRMACLRNAKTELAAVVEVLASADAAVVQKAHRVADGLGSIDRCADVEALQAEHEPSSPEHAEALEQIRATLAASKVQREAGRYAEAQARLEHAEGLAEPLGDSPIVAELALERSHVLQGLGDFAAAEPALRLALRQGARFQRWTLVRDAATVLIYVVGDPLAQPEQALRYMDLVEGLSEGVPEAQVRLYRAHGTVLVVLGKYPEAEAEFRRALALHQEGPNPSRTAVATLLNNIAITLREQGKYTEAEAEYREALTIRQEELGPRHPLNGMLLNNLGNVLHAQGKYAEAEIEFRRTLALWREVLGPDHPTIAGLLNNLASNLLSQDKLDEAEAMHREALALRLKNLGPDHPEVASSQGNLAIVLHAKGQHAEAEAMYRSAVELHERKLGPDHPEVANTLSNLAMTLLAEGKLAECETANRRALAVRQQALGPDHPLVATSHNNLGLVLRAQDELTEAEAEFRRALELRLAIFDDDHTVIAASRMDLASTLLDQQRDREALPLAELAWDHFGREDVVAEDRAEAAFTLARALWAKGSNQRRAGELARQALLLYEQEGTAQQSNAAEVRAWIREHP